MSFFALFQHFFNTFSFSTHNFHIFLGHSIPRILHNHMVLVLAIKQMAQILKSFLKHLWLLYFVCSYCSWLLLSYVITNVVAVVFAVLLLRVAYEYFIWQLNMENRPQLGATTLAHKWRWWPELGWQCGAVRRYAYDHMLMCLWCLVL